MLSTPAVQAEAKVKSAVYAKPPGSQTLPANGTHHSLSNPLAELARSENGVTELNYKEHRWRTTRCG